MKRILMASCLALSVAVIGCAKTKPETSQMNPKPAATSQVSPTQNEAATGPQERTTLKPVAPVENQNKAVAPAEEHKTATAPTASHEAQKAGPAEQKASSSSAAKVKPAEQKTKESTPASNQKPSVPKS